MSIIYNEPPNPIPRRKKMINPETASVINIKGIVVAIQITIDNNQAFLGPIFCTTGFHNIFIKIAAEIKVSPIIREITKESFIPKTNFAYKGRIVGTIPKTNHTATSVGIYRLKDLLLRHILIDFPKPGAFI
jgi:hypothetical protein